MADKQAILDILRAYWPEAGGQTAHEEFQRRRDIAARKILALNERRCDCAALDFETSSHERHCNIYRDPERELAEIQAEVHRLKEANGMLVDALSTIRGMIRIALDEED